MKKCLTILLLLLHYFVQSSNSDADRVEKWVDSQVAQASAYRRLQVFSQQLALSERSDELRDYSGFRVEQFLKECDDLLKEKKVS